MTCILFLLIAVFVGIIVYREHLFHKRFHASAKDLIEAVPDALLICDPSGKIVVSNTKAEILFGYNKYELSNLKVEDLMPERFRKHHAHMRDHFNEKPEIRSMGMGRDLWIMRKDGSEVPAEIALGFSEHGILNQMHTIVLLYDITERKAVQEKVHRLAYYDQLTDIPNRAAFYRDSAPLIERSIENKNNLAFLIFDIKELKKINDTLGHYVGDDVLQRTGSILNKYVEAHQHDSMCNMNLYKIGGDEFLFMVEYEDVDNSSYISEVCKEIINLFSTPIKMDGISLDIHIDVNIGISILPIHGMSASQLLKTADIALIESKHLGKNVYTYYNKAINTEFENFVLYENAIKYFIKTNDFDVYFQPVWNMKRKAYTAAEVLFRCNEKLFPDLNVEFLINVAESTGLIVPLGSAILERACIESKKHDITNDGMIISVNASVQQIEKPGFSNTVIDILDKTETDPTNVAIEITETVLISNEGQIIEKLEHLREKGIKIYIDDFGKGYSSMAYLKNLPVDKLKIDMVFLEGIETEVTAVEILKSIVDLGHALEMIVCTEGIETEQQKNILENIGGDEIQGYFTGKPMKIEDMKDHINKPANSEDEK